MSRGDQITAQRRRRNSDDLSGTRKRLAVDEGKLDRTKYAYRWINDVGDRVRQLTVMDDWEVVPDRDGSVRDTASEGASVSVTAGEGERGAPMRAILVRKPIDLYNDDHAAKQRRIDETEASMRKARGEQTYAPGGGNTMRSSVEN